MTNYLNVLHVVFIVQALFGCLLVVNERRYLGLVALLVNASVLMVFNILEENGVTAEIHLVTPIFALTNGPFFYLFVRQLVFSDAALSKKDWLHFVPAILCLPFTNWVQFILFLGTVSQLVYVMLSLKLVSRYHRGSKEYRSDAYSLRVDWVRQILLLFMLTAIVDLVRLNLQPYLGEYNNLVWYFFNQLAYFVIVCWLIFKAIRQPQLFDGLSDFESQTLLLVQTDEFESQRQHAQLIFSAVDEYLRTSLDFKKPRYSLGDLSQAMQLQQREISQAINLGGGLSFCDYINRLRIDAFKQALATSSKPINLLELAFESGFNSKSTFNAVFRKETGVTPSNYLKSIG